MLSAMLSSFLWSVCSRRVVLVSVRSFKIICSKGCRRPKANNHKGIGIPMEGDVHRFTKASHLLLDNGNDIGIYIVTTTVHFISLSDPRNGSSIKNTNNKKQWI
jgi:hypothetical protein